MREDEKRKANESEHSSENRMKKPPYRIHLPGFLSEEDIGLGDVVKRVISSLGIKPCGGCERRAEALNRGFVFSGRRSR